MDLTTIPEALGMGAMAAVLLYHTLRKSQESDRAISAIACTIVALQKAMIVMDSRSWLHTVEKLEAEDCRECLAAFERMIAILEEQEKTLNNIYAARK